jgi:23S rRNA (adenine2503-C2)-methyltransferase
MSPRPSNMTDERVDLKSLSLDGLEQFLSDGPVSGGKERYRSRQLFKWMWQRRARTFDEMTNVAKDTRSQLAGVSQLSFLDLVTRQESTDGTRKYLWRLHDGHHIESVLIPDFNRPSQAGSGLPGKPRLTLCVSTQVGCAMKCSFCLTGDLGLKRHLTPAEIANQPLQVQEDLGDETRITNIVMMGMGEPLHNFDNLIVALENMLAEDGLGYSHRKITVSTVGLVPKMKELALRLPVNIAVSLNSTTEEQRRQVMPVTHKYGLEELMQACRDLPLPNGKRITFEYVMMGGFNDDMADAERLVRLMRGVRSKVNLIPYNENPDRDIRKPSADRVKAFQHHLVSHGIQCSVRATRGQDISAACGQLGKAACGQLGKAAQRLPDKSSES